MTETAQNGWITRTGHDPSNATNPKMLRLPETDNRNGKNSPTNRKNDRTHTRRTAHQKKQNRTSRKSRATHKLNGEPSKNRQTENRRHDTKTDNFGTNHPVRHWRKSQLPEAISGDEPANRKPTRMPETENSQPRQTTKAEQRTPAKTTAATTHKTWTGAIKPTRIKNRRRQPTAFPPPPAYKPN